MSAAREPQCKYLGAGYLSHEGSGFSRDAGWKTAVRKRKHTEDIEPLTGKDQRTSSGGPTTFIPWSANSFARASPSSGFDSAPRRSRNRSKFSAGYRPV